MYQGAILVHFCEPHPIGSARPRSCGKASLQLRQRHWAWGKRMSRSRCWYGRPPCTALCVQQTFLHAQSLVIVFDHYAWKRNFFDMCSMAWVLGAGCSRNSTKTLMVGTFALGKGNERKGEALWGSPLLLSRFSFFQLMSPRHVFH